VTRRLLALVLAVTVAVGCGGGASRENGTATPRDRRIESGAIPGHQVQIGGGRSLFVNCVGAGTPAVVLESGLGTNASQWSSVQPQLGRSTRVCSYDRAGTGSSVAPPGVRNAGNEIADLRRWPAHAGIAPPYVLVGHSYGGVLARVFAHRHPTETAGLVLIDTMGRDGRRRQLAVWPRSQAPELRSMLATTVTGNVDTAAGEAIASRVRTLGDMPLVVVDAARQKNFLTTPQPLQRRLRRLWSRMHDEFARLSDDSVGVTALRSDHDVASSAMGQPSVVIRAVQAVVRAVRDGTRLPTCPRIFSGPDVRCRE
jgi:pimeloyl-ACP methyl ester carboxylesterase